MLCEHYPNWIHSVFLWSVRRHIHFLDVPKWSLTAPCWLSTNRNTHIYIYRYVQWHIYIYIHFFIDKFTLYCHLTGTFQTLLSQAGVTVNEDQPADLGESGAQGLGQCWLEFMQCFFELDLLKFSWMKFNHSCSYIYIIYIYKYIFTFMYQQDCI